MVLIKKMFMRDLLIRNWLHNFIIDNLAPMNAMFKPEILISNYGNFREL